MSAERQWYRVVMLYPENFAGEYGDSFVGMAKAASLDEAEDQVKQQCLDANDFEGEVEPDDFVVLDVSMKSDFEED